MPVVAFGGGFKVLYSRQGWWLNTRLGKTVGGGAATWLGN